MRLVLLAYFLLPLCLPTLQVGTATPDSPLLTFYFTDFSLSQAQGPGNPLTLAEALAWGVDNNLAVAGQRLNVEVASRNDNWVTAGRNLRVDATLDLAPSLNSQDNPASFINGTFFNGAATAGLRASYTLFNGYRVRFAKRGLTQTTGLAEAQVRQLIETSVFEVAEAYYGAQLAAATRRLSARILDVSRDRITLAELRRAYGQAQAGELLQARTAYFTDSIALRRAGVDVDNAIRRVYLALDAPAERFAGRPIGDTLVYEPRDWDATDVAAAIDSSATLDLLRRQRQFALTQTELARTALQPVVNVSAGLSHTRTGLRFLGELPAMGPPDEFVFGSSGNANVGLTAAYTLFDGGLRRREVANAITQERIAEVTLRNTRQDASLQARSLLASYRNQRDLLDLQTALIANAEANLAIADERLRAGSINSFDYREVQLAYFRAVQGRLQAVHDILLTDLNLRRLTGRLLD